MSSLYFIIVSVTTGFVGANYIAQVLNKKKDWLLATERSLFQIVLVVTICIVLYFK